MKNTYDMISNEGKVITENGEENIIKNTYDMISNEGKVITENSAAGYKSEGPLENLACQILDLRNRSEIDIINMFDEAYRENPNLALRYLFFARDIREGLGERRFFKVVLSHIMNTNPELGLKLVPYIKEYGRFDDLLCLFDYDAEYEKYVASYILDCLNKDFKNYKMGKPISLLAKWLPSINTSSDKTKKYARKLLRYWGMPEPYYRKTLSRLRKYLNVTEVNLSAKKYSEIDYGAVPSKAALKYSNVFQRKDGTRYYEYLRYVVHGDVACSCETDVTYPHEIAKIYRNCRYRKVYYDEALETAWKNLKDFPGCGNTIVVRDGSFQLRYKKINETTTVDDVTTSLAIYFAERLDDRLQNRFITFSNRPRMVDLSDYESLAAKLFWTRLNTDSVNINIETVFDLVLDFVKEGAKMPERILVLSGKEFDESAVNNSYDSLANTLTCTNLFDKIKEKYESSGYKLPKLIFWNICSRTDVPIRKNESGVTFLNGFSQTAIKIAMGESTDMMSAIMETLVGARYDFIDSIIPRQ